MAFDSAPRSGDLPAEETVWQEIDELVDDVARLTVGELSARQFQQALLDRAVRGLAAVGGAIWVRTATGQIQLECQVNLDGVPIAANWADAQRHTRLLDHVLTLGEGRIVAPLATVSGDPQAANPTDYLLLVAPLAVDAGASGLIEVFQRPQVSPAAERGYLRFLATLNELATDFQRNRQLRQLRDRELLWQRFDRFVQQIHGSLDLRTTAYSVANDGRSLAGCDRLSVGLFRGKRCRLLAVSGVDRFDPRAESVRLLEQLAAAVVKTEEPLWHDDTRGAGPPQIEAPLQALVDETHARSLAVLPLWADATATEEANERNEFRSTVRRPLGVLVVEQFESGRFEPTERERIAAVARHSAVALGNAKTHHDVPFLPMLQALGRVGWFVRARQLPKTTATLAVAAAVVLALVLVPADFDITARGRLQPVRRAEVFAPADGIIDELAVDHGASVNKGGHLGRLRKPQLDFESTRVSGELQTAQKRLDAIQNSLLAGGRDAPSTPEKLNQLTAEQEETKAQLTSLKRQQQILAAQRAELELRSPLDGSVLTWNLQELLAARPVIRGQALLTVADLAGPWVAELNVPDDRIGHVVEAEEALHRGLSPFAESAEQEGTVPLSAAHKLQVSFLLATEPGVSHKGGVEKIALAADTDKAAEKSAGATVLVTVGFDRTTIPADQLRPGATVVAKIHCGRRSLGYVWLHELWETIQSHLLF